MEKRAIFNAALLENSVADNVPDALKEWTLEKMERGKGNCICTQDLKHLFLMRNEINGNEIVVGSICVDLFGDDRWIAQCSEARKEASRKTTRCDKCSLRYQKTIGYCPACFKRCLGCEVVIDNIHWKPLCGKCYGERSQNCITCKKVFLPKFDYCKRCPKCYYASK
jgi:hypothetical protein